MSSRILAQSVWNCRCSTLLRCTGVSNPDLHGERQNLLSNKPGLSPSVVRRHHGQLIRCLHETSGTSDESDSPGVFTLFESLTIGTIVSFFDKILVIQAIVITAVIVLGLTMYTFQTKRDFSAMGACLYACLCVLLAGGIIQVGLSFNWAANRSVVGRCSFAVLWWNWVWLWVVHWSSASTLSMTPNRSCVRPRRKSTFMPQFKSIWILHVYLSKSYVYLKLLVEINSTKNSWPIQLSNVNLSSSGFVSNLIKSFPFLLAFE